MTKRNIRLVREKPKAKSDVFGVGKSLLNMLLVGGSNPTTTIPPVTTNTVSHVSGARIADGRITNASYGNIISSQIRPVSPLLSIMNIEYDTLYDIRTLTHNLMVIVHVLHSQTGRTVRYPHETRITAESVDRRYVEPSYAAGIINATAQEAAELAIRAATEDIVRESLEIHSQTLNSIGRHRT